MRFDNGWFSRIGIMVMLFALLISAVTHENIGRHHSVEDEKPQGRAVLEVGAGHAYGAIQEAIDAGPVNSLILVHPGDYYENLHITQSLEIRGMNNSEVILHPPKTRSESRAPRILITSATPTITEGLTIEDGGTGWDDYAVKIQDGNGHIIRNCVLQNCKQGVWVHSESDDSDLAVENIVIEKNDFQNVAGHGVYLQGATGCLVENNSFTNCGDGVMVAWNSSGNVIKENDFVDGGTGCVFTKHPADNTVANNRFEGCNYGIFIEDGSPEIHGNSFTSTGEYAIYGVLKKTISDNEMVNVANGIVGYVIDDIGIRNNEITCSGFSALAFEVSGGAKLTVENNVIDHAGSAPAVGILGGGAVSLLDLAINTTAPAIHVVNSTGVRITNSRFTGHLASSAGTVRITGTDGIGMENVNITGGGLCLIRDSRNIKMTSVDMYCGSGDGLHLANSSDVILINCSVSGNPERGVALERCVNAQLSEVKVDSAGQGFEFSGEKKENFIHSVESSCSTNGNPVYYHSSVTGQRFTHPEAGQVILADTADCTLEGCDLSDNDGILVAYSSGAAISDCRLNRTRYGLKAIHSQDLSVENTIVKCDAERQGNLHANASSLSATDSRFSAPPGMTAVAGRCGSTIDMYNSTCTSLDVESGGGAILSEFWELSLVVRYSDNFTPVVGADILIRSDSKDIYNTIMYNGDDPKTDSRGRIPPVWFPSRRFDHNNSPAPLIPVEVYSYFRGEREWDNASVHYFDNNSHLYLVTSDIRRPPGVEITGLSPVAGMDALSLSWNESNDYYDEISLFRLFIWGDGDGDPRILEIPGDEHNAILNATDHGFIDNETYHLYIIAVDRAGFESDPSTIKDVVHRDHLPPESPTALFNGTPGANNVSISWSKSASGDTLGYRLYLGKRGNETGYILAGEYDNHTNSTTIERLHFEMDYTLYVVAFDEANNTSPPGMRLNITTGRAEGTLMLIVVDSESGTMLEGALAELRDEWGWTWNGTTTDEPLIIPLYGGKYSITVTLDNYTGNKKTFNITHENLTRLVLEMTGVPDPVEADDDDLPDDDTEIDDDDGVNGETANADRAAGIPAWFIIFVAAMLIPLLLLVAIFLRRRNRHRSRVKVTRYVGPSAGIPFGNRHCLVAEEKGKQIPAFPRMKPTDSSVGDSPALPPPPPPPRPPSFPLATMPPAAIENYVPGETSLQVCEAMAPATMHPYGRLNERLALPMYAGDGSPSHDMTDPNAPLNAMGSGPFPEGSLDDVFRFPDVPQGESPASGMEAKGIPPPPRIIPHEETTMNDGITMDPLPPVDTPGGTETAASKVSDADEAPPGKEEVMSRLKSLIETINKKDSSVQEGVPPAVERSFSDITITLPPDDSSENDVVTTTEPDNPPPPEKL